MKVFHLPTLNPYYKLFKENVERGKTGINGILWTYIKLRSCINIGFTGMCPQYGHEKLNKKSKDSPKKA